MTIKPKDIKISSVYPFDYEKILLETKFSFLSKIFSSGNYMRPYLITKIKEFNSDILISKNNIDKIRLEGFEICTYKDGLEIHGEFVMYVTKLELEKLTNNTEHKDAHQMIIKWLYKNDLLSSTIKNYKLKKLKDIFKLFFTNLFSSSHFYLD